MKVGIDNVLVKRFKKMKNLNAFLNKYFTEYEIKYIGTKKHKEQTIAGLFAAKEAFLKALGIGIGAGVSLKNIEVKHNNNGAPYLSKTSVVSASLKEHGFEDLTLSISHTKKQAIAICIIY